MNNSYFFYLFHRGLLPVLSNYLSIGLYTSAHTVSFHRCLLPVLGNYLSSWLYTSAHTVTVALISINLPTTETTTTIMISQKKMAVRRIAYTRINGLAFKVSCSRIFKNVEYSVNICYSVTHHHDSCDSEYFEITQFITHEINLLKWDD